MPCIPIKNGILCVIESFKPGDLPPEGYLAWHEWAEVQRKAGIKQVECGRCGKWRTPQELSNQTDTYEAKDKIGKPVVVTTPVCSKCLEDLFEKTKLEVCTDKQCADDCQECLVTEARKVFLYPDTGTDTPDIHPLDAILTELRAEYDRSLSLHPAEEWAAKTPDEMLEAIADEYLELYLAIENSDITGEHGAIEESKQVAIAALRAYSELRRRQNGI